MIRNTIVTLIITAIAALAGFAQKNPYNAIRVITKEDAAAVTSALNADRVIKHFCSSCEDVVSHTEDIKTFELKANSIGGYSLFVNNRLMDIASVYIRIANNKQLWKNLAYHLKINEREILKNKLKDVPEFYDEIQERNPYSTNTGLYWDSIMPTEDQFFPSFYLALAERRSEETNFGLPIPTIGAGRSTGRYGIAIKNIPFDVEKVKVKVTFQADRIADPQTFETVLDKSNNTTAVFFPDIIWNLDELRKINNSFSTNFRFTVSINDQPEEKRNTVVRVRSINDALFAYKYRTGDGKQKIGDSRWIFGAYVNEDHPWIDKLLKEARDTGLVNSFHGYQGSEADVYKQLIAIWMMLQKRGFIYSSITDSSNASTKYFSQHVRLFEDSINTSQSNCVDGSVLWVSILRRIGIKAYLILIPGHCYIVIDPDGDKGNKLIGLETTMMGNVDLKAIEKNEEMMAKLGDGGLDKVSINSFLAAVEKGTKSFNANADKFKAFDAGQSSYQYIDIEEIRRRKIYPITR